ncbi:hypothetical protein H7F15_03435 [Pontibacter sp. Tf4]|uniref:hypothetical protein n=1 Tax=Pontibacter sp. Tf4 TaxID=2761620 RepID=UPI001627F402|nr:hypothetical protein [Pontibacter sp. Tf4]MBB6610080.1 hypothetical protein [Pontibacter sp. Tf4]
MTKQDRYTPTVKQTFNAYLDGIISGEELLIKLREIEMQLMSDNDTDDEELDFTSGKGLWIRFFEGDADGLTLPEIEKDLRNPDHPNYKILRHGIAIGLANDELEVYFE